jgi:hypothetical protein
LPKSYQSDWALSWTSCQLSAVERRTSADLIRKREPTFPVWLSFAEIAHDATGMDLSASPRADQPASWCSSLEHPKTDLGFVNAHPRTKNTTTKTMITSVTNPPPMYMINLPS